jgi:hypothetical protein
MLERLVEIQHRFERLAAMGDDESRGFYIEVPGQRRKSEAMPRN